MGQTEYNYYQFDLSLSSISLYSDMDGNEFNRLTNKFLGEPNVTVIEDIMKIGWPDVTIDCPEFVGVPYEDILTMYIEAFTDGEYRKMAWYLFDPPFTMIPGTGLSLGTIELFFR
jgi:hypothetical protein